MAANTDYINSLIGGISGKPKSAVPPVSQTPVTINSNMKGLTFAGSTPMLPATPAVGPKTVTPPPTVPTKPSVQPAKAAFIQSQAQAPAPVGAPQVPSAQFAAPTASQFAAPQPSKLDEAMNKYIESLTATPEEKALRANIAKMSGQASMDYEKALQSGDTMSFAQGEAGRVNRGNQLAIGAQTGALSALAEGRTGDAEANKARVEYLQSQIETPQQQLELKKAQAELDKTLAETGQIGKMKPMSEYERAKFAQDESQFGREYALKVQELNSKSGTGATDAKKQETLSIVSTIDNLLNDKNLDAITGIKSPGAAFGGFLGGMVGSPTQSTLNTFNQLKANLSLDARQKLKGSGAISDFEAKTLDKAASLLGTNLDNNAMRSALTQTRGAMATAAGLTAPVKLTNKSTGETSVVESNREGINSAIQDGFLVEYQ